MLGEFDRLDLPKIEEKILDFWKTNHIFEKSINQRAGRRIFNFYEGPPYANGRPGVHHILARVFKDIILRYKSMAGFCVPRRAGWDTHGLPVEIAAEKVLGIQSKKEIEELGVGLFNQKAKASVFEYKDEWEKMTERIGYWLDLKNAYITYENSYIEKLWGAMKEISRRGLFKKDYKVLPWCPRCQTSLASHELAQPGVYKIVPDPSLYLKIPIVGEEGAYLLIWTTTPWTLPANVLVAVNPTLEYKKYRLDGERIWSAVLPPGADEQTKFEKKALGKELVGLIYQPIFGEEETGEKNNKKKHQVVAADFVSDKEGTGLVHIAPAFGEDDLTLAQKIGLDDFPLTVNDNGEITGNYPGAGLFIKEADKLIIENLKERGLVFKISEIDHEYPHCWRCGTLLIYTARHSWFIEVSRIREKLINANQKINWVPQNIKEGRFGEWIKDAKDWAVSRERYWGTPLPIWQCSHCKEDLFVGSLKELDKKAAASGNDYFILRHAEADSNVLKVVSCAPEKFDIKLTAHGEKQAKRLALLLKIRKIDLIYSSPIRRTKETAEIIANSLGLTVHYDNRLTEYNVGVFNGRPIEEFHDFMVNESDKFLKIPEGGEGLNSVRQRMMAFIQELEKTYQNKKILIVGHGDPLWMLEAAAQGLSDEATVKLKEKYIRPGELRKIKFWHLPYNEEGKLDLHRPYIDQLEVICPKCRVLMRRTPEVADVWFDSGAMPFAAGFYPKNFPADYICEGVDQTRGWFYTLLAISCLLGKGEPYRNVICLGLILDKYGQKMSKSKGNVVNPNEIINKYGVDAIRWYFYTINDPGEVKRFNEEELASALRRFFLIIYNVFVFYRTYGQKPTTNEVSQPKHILDKWITARLHQTIEETTNHLKNYEIMKAARNIEILVDDLSRWHLRRSRNRFQRPENQVELNEASLVLYQILAGLSRLIAPFSPFFGEALYLSLVKGNKQSIHLEDWPKSNRQLIDQNLLSSMAKIRELSGQVLALRSKAGIKTRQPLPVLKIKNKDLLSQKELMEVLKEEVNVKEIIVDETMAEDVWLDTAISSDLKKEGLARELTRLVQGLRQKANLKPKNKIKIFIQTSSPLLETIRLNEKKLCSDLSADSIEFKTSVDFTIKIETEIERCRLWLGIKKLE